MISIQYVLSALLAASVVSAHPAGYHKRATPQVYSSCINSNDIALTFDDGPYIYLRTISDAFTNAGAKCTFFMNGNNWDCIYNSDRISDVKYAYAAGHMIGSHTWSHADLTTLNNAQIEDEMFRMEEAFSRILGILPAFMRPPYGDYNDNIQSIAAGRGQSLALWDWDTGDADGNTTAQSEAVYNDVVADKVKNALILEHETEESTADTLVPYAINLFQSKGYNLVTMAQCLGLQPYQAVGVPQQQTSAWTCDGTPDPGDACSGSQCETGTPVFSSTTSAPGSGPTGSNPPPSGAQVIHPNGNTAKCLTASSNTRLAPVEIEDCVAGEASQQWTVSGNNVVVFGTQCLDVTNGAQANGTPMQITPCTSGNANQEWDVSGTTLTWAGTDFCLDNTGGVVTDGNVVQIWTCTGGGNQVWNFAAATGGSSPPPPPSGGVAITPGASSSLCLTAPTNADGGSVVVEPCGGTASQTWTQSGSTFTIYGNKCLDVTNGSTANGVAMQIWTCTTSDVNQEFSVTTDNRIAWTNHGECLDLTGGSTASGTVVQMWACTNNDNNQVWNIA